MKGLFDDVKKRSVYDEVKDHISVVEDYFDFPSSAAAFCTSLKNSYPWIRDGALFRRRNQQLSLISWNGPGEDLDSTIKDLQHEGFKIKSLTYAHKDMEGLVVKKSFKEWYVVSGFDRSTMLSSHTGKHKNTMSRKIKKGEGRYELTQQMKEEEITKVFWEWAEGAKQRLFMVVTGHYLSYLNMHKKGEGCINLLGFRDKESGQLVGLAGYEVWKDFAQITLMKHSFGDYNFPVFFWIKTVEHILSSHNVSRLFCGSTADKLKQELGFSFEQSYRIVL